MDNQRKPTEAELNSGISQHRIEQLRRIELGGPGNQYMILTVNGELCKMSVVYDYARERGWRDTSRSGFYYNLEYVINQNEFQATMDSQEVPREEKAAMLILENFWIDKNSNQNTGRRHSQYPLQRTKPIGPTQETISQESYGIRVPERIIQKDVPTRNTQLGGNPLKKGSKYLHKRSAHV